MRRRKPKRVEIDSRLYMGWLDQKKPASILEVFTRSARRARIGEKRQKRRARPRRSNAHGTY